MEDGIEDMFLHLLSELNSRFSESQDIVCRVCSFLSMNTYNIMCYIYMSSDLSDIHQVTNKKLTLVTFANLSGCWGQWTSLV